MYNPKALSSKSYHALVDKLIKEVKLRPVLWDKSLKRCHKNKMASEWIKIGEILKQDPSDLKSKWRNVKDTFHREAKKMKIPPLEKRDQPIIEYYEGQWLHFESLLFLWDEEKFVNHADENNQRSRKYIVSIEMNEDKKNQISDSDNNIDMNSDTECQDQDTDFENTPVQILFNEETLDTSDPIDHDYEFNRKRLTSNVDTETPTPKKKQCTDSNKNDSDIDEDLHFAKSLVPFLRKLNPVKKLIIRNEIHSLLLRELLCNRCKSAEGPLPNCKCNFK